MSVKTLSTEILKFAPFPQQGEIGCVIFSDHSISQMVISDKNEILLENEDMIGSFHSHPGNDAERFSPNDLASALWGEEPEEITFLGSGYELYYIQLKKLPKRVKLWISEYKSTGSRQILNNITREVNNRLKVIEY